MKKIFLSILGFFLILGLIACAGISLKTPETKLIVNLTAQNVGYLIAKEKPQLAQKLIDITAKFRASTNPNLETTFRAWGEIVLREVVDDEFLAMNLAELLKLVQVDLGNMESLGEKAEMVLDLFTQFIVGLEAGKR